MNGNQDYYIIIVASLTIIASYFFGAVSKRTGIPSVLLLILLGVGLNYGANFFGLEDIDVTPSLGVLGTVGVIMIVLEAALDLKIERSKSKLIFRSFIVAFFGVIINASLVALAIYYVVGDGEINLAVCLLYAIPISIMSSAIVIPSVGELPDEKREFMIYESAFADIIGIIIFYAVKDNIEAESFYDACISVSGNLLLTIITSIIVSYGVFILFHKLKGQVKIFLLIAVLTLFTTIGKLFHLSTLLLILIFGLTLRNQFLLPKFVRKQIEDDDFEEVFENFNLITQETSFVLRTFFFVIFGFGIALSSLFSQQVLTISVIALIILYVSRYILLRVFMKGNIYPEICIAPRGLISVLLFFSIPKEYMIFNFEQGSLLFMIIATSLIMAVAMIKFKQIPNNENIDN